MADPHALTDRELQGDERPWEKPGGVRRDCEAHRGGLLLFLGVVSVVGASLSCLLLPALIALALGVGVSMTAAHDLRKMEAGVMDPSGDRRTALARDWATFGAGLSFMVLVVLALSAALLSLMIH